MKRILAASRAFDCITHSFSSIVGLVMEERHLFVSARTVMGREEMSIYK
jgi:hypothetical protein